MHFVVQHPHRGQLPDRLANRDGTDVELGGDPDFNYFVSRSYLSGHYFVEDMISDLLTEGITTGSALDRHIHDKDSILYMI